MTTLIVLSSSGMTASGLFASRYLIWHHYAMQHSRMASNVACEFSDKEALLVRTGAGSRGILDTGDSVL